MATGISFGGLGNGFDFQQVVTQLVSLQRAPIDQLTAEQLALRSKLTDYGTLGSSLLKLQGSAAALKLSSGFDRFTASSGDADILSPPRLHQPSPPAAQWRASLLEAYPGSG